METPVEREVAIEISHVTKLYRLGQIGGATLQHDLQSWWARIRGKDDPNLLVDEASRMRGEQFMALDDINLTVYKGEALGIIGRNGAGKSTLLKLLSRVTAPTEGDIDIYGRISSMLEVGTGFHPEMTGRENIYLNGAILGMTRAEVDRKIDDIIEFSEIGQFIDTPVKRYSSGMYVKLAFSVAAHLDNEIMIMDEVLAVGDAAFREKCLKRMRAEARSGKTVLYVSHSMETIRELCDRCVVLRNGRIVFDGNAPDAIDVYLDVMKDSSFDRDELDADEEYLKRNKVRVTQVEYLDKEDIRFHDGDPMVIRLRWRNLADYRNLCLRYEVWADNGWRQATGCFYDLCAGTAGEDMELVMGLDVTQFAYCSYKTTFTFFFEDGEGSVVDGEVVTGLFFEHVPPEGVRYWNIDKWGYMRIDSLHLIEEPHVVGAMV